MSQIESGEDILVVDISFERVRRALLRQGEGDRVPLFEISVHKDHKSAVLGRPIKKIPDEIDFWRTAGYDFVPVRAGVRSVVRGLHPAVKEWAQVRYGDDFAHGAEGWAMESTALIRERQDLEEFPWPDPEDLGGYNDYGAMNEYLDTMAKHLPADMKLLVQLGYLFMGTWQLMGFESFCVNLKDDPELIKDVVDRLGAIQLAVLEIVLQYNCVGTIWMPDDLCYNSGPITPPKVYRKYIYPWYVKIVERCHQANMPIGLHSDGDLSLLLPDLVACGFDCIHPFEPPMNDIIAIKHTWGDRIAVAGGVDLKKTICGGTPEDVEAEVREMIAALAPGGGWLLGSSNSIPDFAPIDNYKALLAAGLKYGTYSDS
ncbi:MAG: hypothetical protein M5U01_03810 [Ardenticatenaceae bacterium]|nr:hypothetical protein [Ardenticatenaceae bacterium]